MPFDASFGEFPSMLLAENYLPCSLQHILALLAIGHHLFKLHLFLGMLEQLRPLNAGPRIVDLLEHHYVILDLLRL